jgi:hypothetical protein
MKSAKFPLCLAGCVLMAATTAWGQARIPATPWISAAFAHVADGRTGGRQAEDLRRHEFLPQPQRERWRAPPGGNGNLQRSAAYHCRRIEIAPSRLTSTTLFQDSSALCLAEDPFVQFRIRGHHQHGAVQISFRRPTFSLLGASNLA